MQDFSSNPVRPTGTLDAAQFGVLNDGKTDDSAALQAASDAAAAEQLPLYFAPGTYLVGSTVRVVSSSKWVSLPGTATILTSNNTSIISIVQASDVSISGLTFSGSDDEGAAPLIVAYKSSGLTLSDDTVTQTRGIGILLSDVNSSGINHSSFSDVGNASDLNSSAQGIAFSNDLSGWGTGNGVNGSDFHEIGLDAISATGQTEFSVTDNRFVALRQTDEWAHLPAAPAAIYGNFDQDLLIAGNSIDDAAGNGIDVANSGEVSISNNTVSNSGSGGIGLAAVTNATIRGNVTVDNNVLRSFGYRGGIVIGDPPGYGQSRDILIRGNISGNTDGVDTQESGIQISSTAMAVGVAIAGDNILVGDTGPLVAGGVEVAQSGATSRLSSPEASSVALPPHKLVVAGINTIDTVSAPSIRPFSKAQISGSGVIAVVVSIEDGGAPTFWSPATVGSVSPSGKLWSYSGSASTITYALQHLEFAFDEAWLPARATTFSASLTFTCDNVTRDEQTVFNIPAWPSSAGASVSQLPPVIAGDVNSPSQSDPLFDAAFYLAQNPDVAAARVDPYLHFMADGWKEDRNPDSLFDTRYYLSSNPDVAAAGVNPLVHYEQYGWKEGRNPSVSFDTNKYLSANSDVKAAGLNPLTQYLQTGQAEGRQAYAVAPPSQDFGYTDTSDGRSDSVAGDGYSGPIPYLQHQYIWSSPDNVAIAASVPNVFLHGGAGNDALAAKGGSNVLDGGGGSNFLVGATGEDKGSDTFFVVAGVGAPTWSTIVNFHVGDVATIFGFHAGLSSLTIMDSEGAVGYRGLTIHSEIDGPGTGVAASITFAGIDTRTAAGHFVYTTGTLATGNDYLLVQYH